VESKKNGVHTTRDVIWLRRMVYIVKPTDPEIVVDPGDDIIMVTPKIKK
jgi:hypothetical protein